MKCESWKPNEKIEELIVKADLYYDGINLVDLFDATTFVLHEKFWRLGISLTKDKILFHPRMKSYPVKYQAQKIVHELTHSAQRVKKGSKFNLLYFFEWVRAGFSYERMKEFGFELEAINMEENFRQATRGC